MEIITTLITLAFVSGLYFATGAVYGRVLLSQLLSEKKLHLTLQGGKFYVAAGQRRSPIALSDVPSYEGELRRLRRNSITNWPRMMFEIYGPDKGNSLRDDLMSKAVMSQRNALGIELMRRGLDNHPAMTYLYGIETDEGFTVMRKLIEEYDRRGKIELTDAQRKALEPKEIQQVRVLYPERRQIDPTKPVKAISGLRDGLPHGYIWDLQLRKDSLYEKLYVKVKSEETGKTIVEDGFYTHIWNTPGERKRRVAELKRQLQLKLEAKVDPEGHKRKMLESLL